MVAMETLGTDQEPIVITCEYRPEELRRATMYLLRRRRRAWVIVPFLIAFILLLVLVGNGFSGRRALESLRSSSMQKVFLPILPWLGMWLVLVIGLRYWARRRMRGFYRRSGTTTKQYTYVFRSDGLILTEPHARHEFGWAAFSGWKELRKMFLIQLSPVTANVIPKRVFKDTAEADRFRTFLREHINSPSAKNAFPIQLAQPATPAPLPPVGEA